ncbi:unnamed protein product, partial [Rotaria sordida]
MIDKTRRSNETAEQHRIRLEQQHVIDTTRRSDETAEQHRIRLEQQHVIDTTRRSNETAEQYRIRLEQQHVIDTTRRSNETAEQHRIRLEQQHVIDTTRRSNETAEQHRIRLEQQQHIIAGLPADDVPESIWETLDYILDDKNAHAEREGYTEDPLTSSQAMSENATSDFIPINPSGVLDVNGASVSVEDINNHMLRKLRIDANKQSANLSETNTDDDLIHMIPRGGAPTNEYNNPTLLLGLYPTLFPYGTGAFEDASRPVKISFKKQIQYLLSYHDRRFEEHHSFIFIVFNMLQRREACLHARLMTSKPFFSKTADQIASLNADDIKQVLNGFEKNKINTSSRNPQVNALLSQVKAVGGK